jgi:hypothetical protein
MIRRTALAVCLLAVAPWASAQEAADAPATAEPDAKQIAGLEQALSNSALVGQFTITGAPAPNQPAAERYDLGEVKYLGKGQWLIQARIRYGEHDVPLPLTLPIRWAGDTPVICVDEMAFPGLGTYTARVMIYRDHYAGFWTGKDHGGHLFGEIKRGEGEGAAANNTAKNGEKDAKP